MNKRELKRRLNSPELLHALADVEHARWSRWEAHRAKQMASPDAAQHEERWRKQRETPYAKLSDKEQASDQREARNSLTVITDHIFGSSMKTAFYAGQRAALLKFGLDDTRSSPYTLDVHMPSTSPDGRETMIDQAFNTNDQLGEYGQTADGFVSAVNNVLQPGSPPVGEEEGRHFTHTTDQSGGDL